MKISYTLLFLAFAACAGPDPLDQAPDQNPDTTNSPTPKQTSSPTPQTNSQYSGWGIQYSSAGETARKLSSVSLSITSNTKAITRIKHDRLTRGVMVGTNGSLLSLSANGKEISEMNSPDVGNIRDAEIRGTETWVLGKDSSGGESVWLSVNNGVSWTKELNTSSYYFEGDHTDDHLDRLTSVVALGESGLLVTGTLRDGMQILLRKDSSGAWTDEFISASMEVTRLTSIARTGIDSYVLTGDNGLIASSFDDGVTWDSVQLSADKEVTKVSCADIVCFVSGDSGLLFVSGDAGATWEETPVSPTENNITAVSAIVTDNGYRVYIGESSGRIYHSDDLGLSWVSQGKKSSLPIADIFMLTKDFGVAASSFQTGTTGSILIQEKL